MHEMAFAQRVCRGFLNLRAIGIAAALALVLQPGLSRASERIRDAGELARAYAGLTGGADSGITPDAAYRTVVDASWQAYRARIAVPMAEWARTEIAYRGSGTVFYPFSGPDLVTVAYLFPDAERYVLVAMQKARRPVELRTLRPTARKNFNDKFSTEWRKFGRLGFFRTNDLDEDARSKDAAIGVTPILMAFAARLGYEVVDVTPIALNPGTGDFDLVSQNDGSAWESVRLTLAKGGRTVKVDYVSMNLSDINFNVHGIQRAWLERVARNPVLFKAASHLVQKPSFSVIRDAVVAAAPIVVQDETGLDYTWLAKVGDISLYGGFVRPYSLFDRDSQRSLAVAYRKAKTVGKLPFAFSYNKGETQRCMQIARRVSPPLSVGAKTVPAAESGRAVAPR